MKVSLVIPCYNEEKNIDRTLDGLIELLNKQDYDYEIIAVNDGSTDKTWEVIKKYSEKHPQIIGLNQMTNFGQSAAYQAGFDGATGDYVVTVSADLETPLENITKVVDLLYQGYDFVNTNRLNRWGGEKGAKSGLANKIIAAVSGVKMRDRGSGMKGFSRVLVQNLKLYGEMHRFIPDYVTIYGAKSTEFDVDFKDREYGESYYKGQKRTVKVLLDILTLAFLLYFAKKPFTAMPGRLFGFTGAIITTVGLVLSVYLAFIRLFLNQSIGDRPLLVVSILMVVIGLQSMITGMLGELMMRTYFESSGRKTYVIREIASLAPKNKVKAKVLDKDFQTL